MLLEEPSADVVEDEACHKVGEQGKPGGHIISLFTLLNTEAAGQVRGHSSYACADGEDMQTQVMYRRNIGPARAACSMWQP